MNEMQKAQRLMSLASVIRPVHAQFGLVFEKYAVSVESGEYSAATESLEALAEHLSSLLFLVAEMSAADPTQQELPIDPPSATASTVPTDGKPSRPVLVGDAVEAHRADRAFGEAFGTDWIYAGNGVDGYTVAEVEAIIDAQETADRVAPAVPAAADAPRQTVVERMHAEVDKIELQIHEALQAGQLDTLEQALPTVELLPTDIPVVELQEAREMVDRVRTWCVDNNQMEAATHLMEAGDTMQRMLDTTALVAGAQQPQVAPHGDRVEFMSQRLREPGDMAAMSDFAVCPGVDPQLVVGVLTVSGTLVWSLAGDVPQGSFITMRQRLQNFADSLDAVELAKAVAA